MDESPFGWVVQALTILAGVIMLGDGVMLSRGTSWMFKLGIPLPRKSESG